MDTVLGWSVAMPSPCPRYQWHEQHTMPDTSEIDWWKTLSIPAAMLTIGVMLRAVFLPLWEKMVRSPLKEDLELLHRIAKTTEQLDERLHGFEANYQLANSIEALNENVRFCREQQECGLRQMRREGSPVMQGGRRKDDPPRKRE